MAEITRRAIEDEINRLRSLALEELRGEWRRLYSSEPPQISRDLLVLGLGYRLQEIDQGGLGKATRRKMQSIAKNHQSCALKNLSEASPCHPTVPAQPAARRQRLRRGARR